MDRRAVFDKVKAHLLQQGKRATSPRAPATISGCSYRGDSGTKCAIGCLIADEHYSPGLEGWGVAQTTVAFAVCKSLGIPNLDVEDFRLLNALQAVHDLDPVERWPASLDQVERSCLK